jgi:hypothetical protein
MHFFLRPSHYQQTSPNRQLINACFQATQSNATEAAPAPNAQQRNLQMLGTPEACQIVLLFPVCGEFYRIAQRPNCSSFCLFRIESGPWFSVCVGGVPTGAASVSEVEI